VTLEVSLAAKECRHLQNRRLACFRVLPWCNQSLAYIQISNLDSIKLPIQIRLSLQYRRRKRRRNRLHWVHPIIQNMEEFGAFYTLFGELPDDAKRFLKLFSNVCFIFRRDASPFKGDSSAS
jgi:hypothetical protein